MSLKYSVEPSGSPRRSRGKAAWADMTRPLFLTARQSSISARLENLEGQPNYPRGSRSLNPRNNKIHLAMLAKSGKGALTALSSTPSTSIPAFLLPAFHNLSVRCYSDSPKPSSAPVEAQASKAAPPVIPLDKKEAIQKLFGESRQPRPNDFPTKYFPSSPKFAHPKPAPQTTSGWLDKNVMGKQAVHEAKLAERLTAREGKRKAEDDYVPPPKEPWMKQKETLEKKFPEGWAPRKRLSPDALAGIRAIHQQFPDQYTVPVLAQKFEISPEAVRRILKSKWRPSEEDEEDRTRRWYKRGKEVWTRYAELGLKPPRKWRDEGIGKRPKGWRSAEKEQREREAEELRTTKNPRLFGSSLPHKDDFSGDGFV